MDGPSVDDIDSSFDEGGSDAPVGSTEDESDTESANRQRYSDLFSNPWHDQLEILTGRASTQVLINGDAFTIADLDNAIAAFMGAAAVVKVKVDLWNEQARQRALAFVNLAIQSGRHGRQLRSLAVNLYSAIGCELPLLLSASTITELKLKEVHWMNRAYVDGHFAAIKAMLNLRQFSYKYPSHLAAEDPELTPQYVARLLEDCIKGQSLFDDTLYKPLQFGKKVKQLGLHGLKQMNAKDCAAVINGLSVDSDGLFVKVKRCYDVNVTELGRLLSPEVRLALTKLEIHAISTNGSRADFSTYTGLTNLSAAKFIHEPKVDGQQLVPILQLFWPNILSLAGYKNNTGFKLGISQNTTAVTYEGMTRELIDDVEEHKDGSANTKKPDYTWLCKVPPSRHNSSEDIFFRLKIHNDEILTYP